MSAPAGPWSDEEFAEYVAIWQALTGGAKDTLRSLVYRGPVWDGDVPSKAGRDELLRKGLASKAIVKREDGFQVANYKGHRVYRATHLPEYESTYALAMAAIKRAGTST